MKRHTDHITENATRKPPLTMKAAATALAVSVKTVQRLVANGSLDCIRIGKSVRIPAETIARFLEEPRHSTQLAESNGFVKPRVP